MSPSLFLQVFSIEMRKAMTYRVHFWISSVFGVVAAAAVPYFLWRAIYAESGAEVIGGYTFSAMILYYCAIALLSRLVFGQGLILAMAEDIYQGGLSRYLVYPRAYLAFKYAQHLGAAVPYLLQMAFIGVLLLTLLDAPAATAITPVSVLLALPLILVANLLYFLLSYPLQAIAFWADNVWSLSVLLRFITGILGGQMLPLSLYPDWAQGILRSLPFQFLFHLPVRTLLGKVTLIEWAQGLCFAILWCVAIGLAGSRLWRRGERAYTGVGI